ncbi:MAG: hypothetical protein EON51_01905 [Acinetobacter sp.]|nr:MAG: hypothetical protein EON51_01905 [Acinetobacter sp.]
MKNQITKITMFIALMIITAFGAGAQSPKSIGIRYSIGADFGLPTGDLSDNYKWSLGGSLQSDIPLVDVLYATINAGYVNIFTDKSVSTLTSDIHLIPVKVGLKYFPAPNLYLQGEAGASFLLDHKTYADHSIAFVYAPQIGYTIPLAGKSGLDVGLRYEVNSKFYEGGNSHSYLGLRLAYAFGIGR